MTMTTTPRILLIGVILELAIVVLVIVDLLLGADAGRAPRRLPMGA